MNPGLALFLLRPMLAYYAPDVIRKDHRLPITIRWVGLELFVRYSVCTRQERKSLFNYIVGRKQPTQI
ncbi:hypothetical protein SeLEV6574_g00722 [Synchytrium endobioticum]|uniref:Uncharacterized protein n=1 Tax=Synchytrium endobioticum TaxID=286115 RepID=A0A507DGT6_9FUNG|nr:hypothetical protein SeLEV6574_g00722 [Synchytrium endobioticum]